MSKHERQDYDYDDNGFGTRRFYRDTENGMCRGVCAGIARYFGFDVTVVRIVTVIACFLFVPAIFIVYIIMGILVPKGPRVTSKPSRGEERFRQRARRAPSTTASMVRHKFRDLDARVQKLERYVTSPKMDLEKEFEDLKNS
jgi:phage shock protein C